MAPTRSPKSYASYARLSLHRFLNLIHSQKRVGQLSTCMRISGFGWEKAIGLDLSVTCYISIVRLSEVSMLSDQTSPLRLVGHTTTTKTDYLNASPEFG